MITYKKGDDVIIASANVNLNKSLGVILRYSERLDKYEVKLTASEYVCFFKESELIPNK